MNRPNLINDLGQEGDRNTIPYEVLAEALNRPEKYTDDKGFEVELWGGDIHPSKNWIAWVDLHAKTVNGWIHDRYYFRIQVDGKQVFEWEVETYNPAFGAVTVYLHWHDDKVIYIYSEKHNIYGVTATTRRIKHRVELGNLATQVELNGDTITTTLRELNANGQLKQVKYRLPNWEL